MTGNKKTREILNPKIEPAQTVVGQSSSAVTPQPQTTLFRSNAAVAADSLGQGMVPEAVHDVLRSAGEPLSSPARADMESRFGRDFSQVRVHTGGPAAEASNALDARAFAAGRNIVFGAGEYQPESETGRMLLAHELTHVVQQGAHTEAPLRVGAANDPAEQEAHNAAQVIALGGKVASPFSSSGPSIQCDDKKKPALFDNSALQKVLQKSDSLGLKEAAEKAEKERAGKQAGERVHGSPTELEKDRKEEADRSAQRDREVHEHLDRSLAGKSPPGGTTAEAVAKKGVGEVSKKLSGRTIPGVEVKTNFKDSVQFLIDLFKIAD